MSCFPSPDRPNFFKKLKKKNYNSLPATFSRVLPSLKCFVYRISSNKRPRSNKRPPPRISKIANERAPPISGHLPSPSLSFKNSKDIPRKACFYCHLYLFTCSVYQDYGIHIRKFNKRKTLMFITFTWIML